MKIEILKDFRTLKQSIIYDFSKLPDIKTIVLVGPNGSGKSTLLHTIRGLKNDAPTSSLYNRDYEMLTHNVNITHDYEKIFHLDSIKDNGLDFQNAYDACALMDNGGFVMGKKSHGESEVFLLSKFLHDIKEKVIPHNTLIVLDEVDKGFSLEKQVKFTNMITNLNFAWHCDVFIVTHNPFLMLDIGVVYDLEKNNFVKASDYVTNITGYAMKKKKYE